MNITHSMNDYCRCCGPVLQSFDRSPEENVEKWQEGCMAIIKLQGMGGHTEGPSTSKAIADMNNLQYKHLLGSQEHWLWHCPQGVPIILCHKSYQQNMVNHIWFEDFEKYQISLKSAMLYKTSQILCVIFFISL